MRRKDKVGEGEKDIVEVRNSESVLEVLKGLTVKHRSLMIEQTTLGFDWSEY